MVYAPGAELPDNVDSKDWDPLVIGFELDLPTPWRKETVLCEFEKFCRGENTAMVSFFYWDMDGGQVSEFRVAEPGRRRRAGAWQEDLFRSMLESAEFP